MTRDRGSIATAYESERSAFGPHGRVYSRTAAPSSAASRSDPSRASAVGPTATGGAPICRRSGSGSAPGSITGGVARITGASSSPTARGTSSRAAPSRTRSRASSAEPATAVAVRGAGGSRRSAKGARGRSHGVADLSPAAVTALAGGGRGIGRTYPVFSPRRAAAA